MKIVECPRDAMQGLSEFIPTDNKISYINALLKVGFDTIDFGSFVSPRAIPQMRDTAEVLAGLDLHDASSKLLAIIANVRGAQDALQFTEIDYLGFPLSISETFQQRNTNRSIEEALKTVEEIQKLTIEANKVLVVYISMGFGNPYGETYNADKVEEFVAKLVDMGISTISLADTIGVAEKKVIHQIFEKVLSRFPDVEIGAHFHSTPQTALGKIKAAFEAGCMRFDAAIGGMGGCPMAKDNLTGNIDTTLLIDFCRNANVPLSLNLDAYAKASELKRSFFG